MENISVKNVTIDYETGVITITTTSAKGTIYLEETKDIMSSHIHKTFINSGPLVEGVNIILSQHFHAVNALKADKNYQPLAEENKQLNNRIKQIAAFERGDRVAIDGLTYQKAINENSFYKVIDKS